MSKRDAELRFIEDEVISVNRAKHLRVVHLSAPAREEELENLLKAHPTLRAVNRAEFGEYGSYLAQQGRLEYAVCAFGHYVRDESEAELPAFPYFDPNGEIKLFSNWTRGPVWRWDENWRFLFAEK